jgi:hypothetical protein
MAPAIDSTRALRTGWFGGKQRRDQKEFNAKTPRHSAADAATKEFEQEHTEITEKKKRGEKTLPKMQSSSI